jgi:inosine-uridine nucleoside N-ribohydrolase
MSPDPIPVIFDTDGGVDDYSALWYALVAPDLDLVAVTTVAGVLSATATARNVARVLHAAGRPDIPFAVGAEEQLGPAPPLPPATLMHGEDGLGNTDLPDVELVQVPERAADLIVRLCRERPGELTLVAVGPFTNVALALREEPALVSLVKELVIMGGAAIPPGNATAFGEFNVVFDAVAANEMAVAPWSRPPRMVGLDVTLSATMTDPEFEVLNARSTPQAAFMADPFVLYREMSTVESHDGCASHDTLTMMATAHPDLLQYEELPMSVDTAGGAAWGATIVDFRARWIAEGKIPEGFEDLAREQFFAGKGTWRVALGADIPAVRSEFRRFYGEM